MGMIPKEQVPPMLLIDNPAIDKTKLPHLGDTISGTAKTVTIDDIIAAEGERIPNASTSQKQFNVGFVLLTRAGDSPVAAAQAIETLRRAWAGQFAELTQGAGGISNVPASLNVVIDSPADGTTITGPNVTVTGTVINSSGAETGVMVNGIPVTVNRGRFIANHVPLQIGSNTIAIIATDANGLTSTSTRTVTAQPGKYIQLTTNIESGVAPMDISLRLDGSFILNNPTLTTSGPVPVTLVVGASLAEYTVKLTVEGTYTIAASVVGPDGQNYNDTVTITVINRTQLENLLKRKWEGMKAAIIDGTPEVALNYFVSGIQNRYRAIFADPEINIIERLSEIIRFKVFTVKGRAVQAGAIRLESEGEYAYPVNFVKDAYGVWKILGF